MIYTNKKTSSSTLKGNTVKGNVFTNYQKKVTDKLATKFSSMVSKGCSSCNKQK